MLSRFRPQIVAVAADLRHLKDHPDDLAALLALQLDLISHIRRSERQVARLRAHLKQAKADLRLGRQPKDITTALRKRTRVLERRIDDYQYLKLIWKCFGDGIAFIYLDKFALKHVYFDTTSREPLRR